MHSPGLAASLEREAGRSAWSTAGAAVAVFVAALLAIFWPAAGAAVDVWYNSATFNHCFLIIPVVLWLVFDRRRALARLTPTPDPRMLLAIVPASLLWLIGNFATVLEAQELAVVVMMQAGLIAILGPAVARTIWFPIAYLLFLVPMGEWAVPLLQRITALVAVAGLDAIGVPVFSDGLLIEIPEGKFFVAEACAGMRFLIATLAFGTLFCWLHFRTSRRVALFLLATLLVPIVANSIRAFGIIIVAHLYGSGSAVVADHVVYGWGFFAVIIVLLTAIGWRFRETVRDAPAQPTCAEPKRSRILVATGAAIAVAAIGPTLATLAALRASAAADASRLGAPRVDLPWTARAASAWDPGWTSADARIAAAYSAGGPAVELRIGYVKHQRKGAEAIAFANQFFKKPGMTVLSQDRMTVALAGGALEVTATRVSDATGRHLVWHWYWVNGRFTARGSTAKLQQLVAQLVGPERAAATIMLATEDDREAPARLADVLNHLASLSAHLARASF